MVMTVSVSFSFELHLLVRRAATWNTPRVQLAKDRFRGFSLISLLAEK